mmetsp:Transcript_12067/g.32313  ORF Transcript_12067/g.32313 Transcript_12067/m.32313 type:complete len:242 (-) Transcript_12067:563-1288(-)
MVDTTSPTRTRGRSLVNKIHIRAVVFAAFVSAVQRDPGKYFVATIEVVYNPIQSSHVNVDFPAAAAHRQLRIRHDGDHFCKEAQQQLSPPTNNSGILYPARTQPLSSVPLQVLASHVFEAQTHPWVERQRAALPAEVELARPQCHEMTRVVPHSNVGQVSHENRIPLRMLFDHVVEKNEANIIDTQAALKVGQVHAHERKRTVVRGVLVCDILRKSIVQNDCLHAVSRNGQNGLIELLEVL